MVLQELGIENPAIRQHLLIRETFLANKQRINSLKAYIRSDATEQDIDSAMIASTVRANQYSHLRGDIWAYVGCKSCWYFSIWFIPNS